MTTDQELLEREFVRGQEQGRLEARIGNLESIVTQTTKTLADIGVLVTSTVTTVKLLSQDIQNRADADKKVWEQHDKLIEEAKQLKRDALGNDVNKINKKWIPRTGWTNVVMALLTVVGVSTAVYFGIQQIPHSETTNNCTIIANCNK